MATKSAATKRVKARMEVQDVGSTEGSTPLSPPEEFVPKTNGAQPKPEDDKPPSQSEIFKLAYPSGAQLFWYEPEGGGDPIPFPLVMKNPPDKFFFWELHQVKNPWVQMASYMDRFEVPKTVQRHVFQTLPDPELMVMCNKWFEALGGGATAGE